MRLLRLLAKILGWLLTPIVAWAASFFGAWFGAAVAGFVPGSTAGVAVTVAGAAVTAIGATVLWMRLLRRSPRLREALDVTPEGVPVTVHELAGGDEP